MTGQLEEIQEDDLNFVLCFYGSNVIYHEYVPAQDCLRTGTLLSVEALKTIFSFVNENPDLGFKEFYFKGIIPPNVLKFSAREKMILWTTPQQERTLLSSNKLFKTGKYSVPPLIWRLQKNKLTVFALQSDKDITPETKLFHSPFMNISSDGAVCMGSALFENKHVEYEKIINDAQEKFFNSYFTHTNNNKLLKVNFTTYMESIVGKNTFDLKHLVDTKSTIKILLK